MIIKYEQKTYGVEVKSYINGKEYKKALAQAAHYGQQLGLNEISLIFFVESIDEENRNKLEADFIEPETRVTVKPVFVQIA